MQLTPEQIAGLSKGDRERLAALVAKATKPKAHKLRKDEVARIQDGLLANGGKVVLTVGDGGNLVVYGIEGYLKLRDHGKKLGSGQLPGGRPQHFKKKAEVAAPPSGGSLESHA